MKLNSNSGDIIFAKQYGGPNSDVCHDIEVDSNGYIYCAGHTDGGFGEITTNSVEAGTNAMVLKTDPSGNLVWAKTIGNENGDHLGSNSSCFDLEIDEANNLYCGGLKEVVMLILLPSISLLIVS